MIKLVINAMIGFALIGLFLLYVLVPPPTWTEAFLGGLVVVLLGILYVGVVWKELHKLKRKD